MLPHLAENAGSAAVEADAATKAAAEAGLLHGSAPDAHRALRECNTGRKQGAGMLVAGAKLLAQLQVDSRRGPHAVKLAAAAHAAVLDLAAAAETNRPVVRHDGWLGQLDAQCLGVSSSDALPCVTPEA